MKACTPEDFRNAWCKVWNGKDKSELSEKFHKSATWTEWTDCMLNSDDSFLQCVAKELKFSKVKVPSDRAQKNVYQVEYQRLDMVLMSDYNGNYPYMLDVVIEHENDRHPENEMWKLMLLRSPLKVIIFYDHPGKLLPEKLDELRKMLCKANDAFPENENTDYLFIIGKLSEDHQMHWWWSSDKESSVKELCR